MHRPRTSQQRAKASRSARAEAGEPLPHVVDRALREEVLRQYIGGAFGVDLPDLIEATTVRLISSGSYTRRGVKEVMQRLMGRTGREAQRGV